MYSIREAGNVTTNPICKRHVRTCVHGQKIVSYIEKEIEAEKI